MRKKIVAGNWKMNLEASEAERLALDIISGFQGLDFSAGPVPEVIFFPAFPYLANIAGICSSHKGFAAGAQNCHQADRGAFTGEVSVSMIRSVQATHVLVGHSERRTYFAETDALLAHKLVKALDAGLTPVFCCGEQLSDRESGNYQDVVAGQVSEALFSLDAEQFGKLIIAYEPVWAIGTGLTATPEQAQEMHSLIRKLIIEKYGEGIGERIPLLYGGSCNAANASELFSRPDVDGGLIGGASLKADEFLGIIRSF